MLSGIDDPGESRMGEISMSGSTRERGAAVIGLWAFHSVLSLSTLLVLFGLSHSGFWLLHFCLVPRGFPVKLAAWKQQSSWNSCVGRERCSCSPGRAFRPAAVSRTSAARMGFGNGGNRSITTISCGRKRRGWSIGISSWRGGRGSGMRARTRRTRPSRALRRRARCWRW